MIEPSCFPGRVVFDHLPKTAGMAVNAWLQESLGKRCATGNLIGFHRDLIVRYGGAYSVITAHVTFERPGLDPRYRYVTCLREPVDRMVSWLYYVAVNLSGEEVAAKESANARRFIESEGEDANCGIEWNSCVRHYAVIEPRPQGKDPCLLERAVSALDRYELWGMYEQLPLFIADFATLLQLPPPERLNPVNVTIRRPTVKEASPAMRRRLERLNALDIEFYSIAKSRYEEARRRWQRHPVTVPGWEPREEPADCRSSIPEFCLLSVDVRGGVEKRVGERLQIVLLFSLSIDVVKLDVGIEITDEMGSCAFSTSSALLGNMNDPVAAGTHALEFDLVAYLPAGRYTVGFRFDDRSADPRRYIARFDNVAEVRMASPGIAMWKGYAHLPTSISCVQSDDAVVGIVTDGTGTIQPRAELGDLTTGETLTLPVSICNESSQEWPSTVSHPIVLTYRWGDASGKAASECAGESPLADQGIPAASAVAGEIRLVAPPEPGNYTLALGVDRRNTRPLEAIGFRPSEMAVEVVAAGRARRFSAADARLHAMVGRREGGVRSSNGEPGYLLFGPYVELAAGAWIAVLSGSFDGRHGAIRGDVCTSMGSVVHASCDIRWQCDGVVLPFHLDEPHEGVEVRIWVEASATAAIHELSIEPDAVADTARPVRRPA